MMASNVVIPALRDGVILSTLLGAGLVSPHCENLPWTIPILAPGNGGVKTPGESTLAGDREDVTGATRSDKSNRATVARAATIV
jgi:hypothetical protein